VSVPDALLDESAEDLFETAPCGYLTTAIDGTILRVNRTFEELSGHKREDLLGRRRFQDLLTPGGRIYHETHYAPLLTMQGSVSEIAVEIARPDGSNVPALVNSVLRHDDAGRPRVIRTTVFDATHRRRYEQELLKARRREQEVALELQRGLLGGALQEGEGIQIGVAYRPADNGLEVGGDWYDAFWLEPGETLAIVVGDVVGRGLGAAATMGQLRSALRALASTGLEPGALLEAMSEFSRRHAVGQMATVAYAEIDVRLGSMRYACAGHPPPAIADPAGAAWLASEGRSPPLDAHAFWSDRPDSDCRLRHGAMVVLYTDGLIERRDRPLQAGLDELLAMIDRLRDESPDTVASSLAYDLAGATPGDDVCVLALRFGRRAGTTPPHGAVANAM
jgi:sigma-B regulation protein RsbU (phosphoserine phosphatase)